MFWLRRPPYLRWIAAGAILLIGLLMDLRGPDLEKYPFAAESLPPGEPVDEAVEWRDVPTGLLPTWNQPVSGIAASTVAAGDPLLPSLLAEVVVPDGWWTVPIPLPVVAPPGTRLRVRHGSAGELIDGIVVGAGDANGFEPVGMVAFPADAASTVAAAAANDALVVMLGHDSGAAAPGG